MATNWNDFEPADPDMPRAVTKPGKTDWSQFTPVKADDSSDLGRGFKESFQQLPQLGYGLLAGAGAAGEAVFGEGGISTGVKKAGVAGYQDWGNKIAAGSKESDSWDYSFDQAKQGNFGALVDWLQHGIGYVGGQGAQMLATAGIGAVGGKIVAATAAKQIAERMVAKSAAELASTEAGAKLTAAELTEAATARVADKFASIGQNAAVGAMGFGQEGGEIFGDLSKQSVDEGRSLTGSELGKAFISSLAAGSLEFVGDKIGLDVILGKSKLLKPAESVAGLKGRLARGGIAAAAETPIEAGTEYLQTGLENYGKGKEANVLPFNQSEAAQKDARESAMLGALGGTVIGGAGGAIHGAKATEVAPAPVEAPAPPLAIGNTPDPFISFPDGTVGKRADVDRYVAGLPEDQQHDARAALLGINPQRNAIEKIGASQTVDEAIAAATEAVSQPLELPDVDESALSPFMRRGPGATQERDIAGIKLDAEMAKQLAQREADLDAIGSTAPEARAEFDAQQAARRRAATVEAPSAMELALRRATPVEAAVPAPAAPAEPRIVARTPDMQPTSQAKAQAQADATGGEVVRVQNQSGKFAYVALPASQKEVQPGDLMTGDGQPYGSNIAAKVRARKDGGTVVPVTGGWVVRPQQAEAVTTPATETADERQPVPASPGPASSDRGGPAVDVGSVAADGRLDAVPEPPLPSGDAPAAGQAGDAGLESRADDAAVAAPQPFKTDLKKDGSVTVLGDPAAIKAALPGITGIAGKRGVSYGKAKVGAVMKALKAAQQKPKAKRRVTFDPERDTLLQAVAKMGGINRDELAREFGMKPEELKSTVAVGNLKGFPFRKAGGLSIDGALEQLREAGYFDGVADDATRSQLEEAIFGELGGSPRLSTRGQMRQAEQRGAEDAAEQQARAEAEEFTEADREELDALSSTSEGLQYLPRLDDDDLPGLDAPGETDPAAIMRALGFTEQEINDELAIEAAGQGREAEAGPRAGEDAGGETSAPGRAGSEAPRGAAAEELTLTSPTSEDLSEGAERARQSAADDAAEQKRLAGKAKADAERGEFTLTGSDSPADVAAAAGQGGLFDAPATQAGAIEAIRSSDMPTADKIRLAADVQKGAVTPEAVAQILPVAPKSAPRVDDAGEKIGGARKDRWAETGLTVADLDGMSESEGATHAKKSAVWAPDYVAIAAQSDPVTAAMVKVVYDSLAAKPKTDTPQGRRDYVRAMQAVRKVYGQVKTVQEAQEAYRALRAELGIPADKRYGLTPEEKAAQAVLFSVYKGRSDPFVFDYTALQRAKKLAETGFPGKKAEPWTRRLAVRAGSGQGLTARGVELLAKESQDLGTPMNEAELRAGYFQVRTLGDRPKTVALAPTRQAAEAAAAAHYEGMKAGPGEKQAPDRPHLDEVVREGLDRRQDQDVSSEDFLKAFGFRGIEFGNWAAQDERQRLLNLAFDSLHDLAEILGLPARALSLDGSMGLAFGARGGGKFAAHYESGKLVINMTKLRGAGSLAHEWAHALDHYLGELDRSDAYQGNARGASGWRSEGRYTGEPQQRMVRDAAGNWQPSQAMRLDNLRPELARKIDAVMKRLYEAPISREQAISIERDEVARYERYVADATDAQMRAMYEEGLTRHREMLADLEAGGEVKRTKRSSYASEAQKLSGKSIDGYWVRPTEMFARAFESYVFDRLKAMGSRSDYLVHGVEAERYGDADRYDGNPYPAGAEREAINAAIGAMVGELQTREGKTEGSIALAREDAPTAYGDPSPEESAQVEAGLKGKTLLQAADWLAENAPPELGLIAQAARKQLGRLQLAGAKFTFKIAHLGDQVPRLLLGSRGITSYRFGENAGKGEIDVWLNGADVQGKVGVSFETATHEIVHAATMAAVRLGNLRSQAGTPLAQHVSDLYAVTNFVRAEFNKRVDEHRKGERLLTDFETRMFNRQNNAFADANETITWALTDKDAQTFLESIEYKGKSAWTSFVQIIRSLLGLSPKADTALAEVLRISEELLSDETHTLTDAMLSRDGKDTVMQRGMFDQTLPQDSIEQAHQSTGPTTRDRIADKLRNAGGGRKIIGNTGRAYTPAQLAAMRAVGFQVTAPTLEERAKAIWKDAGKKLAQGLVDQFAPIKEISADAYSLLRLAKGASGAFEAMLQGGKLKLSDGVYDFDETQRGGVVDTLLKPLGGEHHDFFRWVAANRAERLKAEGKENLFTPDDIKALKTLADGRAGFDYELQHGANAGTKTRDRSLIYADALKTFNGFNRNVLDLAEQSGLIDGESRKLWEHEFYVPFYRVAEEEGGSVAGMNIKGGSVRQQAFKQLKGGKQALNADLMDNTLMNWAHLLDASAKNRAAVATLAAAENMGVAITAPESTAREMANSIGQKSNVVWVMDGGQKHFYVVEDPYVMTALTSLEYAGMRSPIMKALGSFKHALTLGVTASPFFKVRNLIRDSVQAIASAPLSYNVAGNLKQGWALTDPKSDAYFRLLAGGGTIHFGTMMEGSEAKRVQALVESGVDAGTVLNSDKKVKAFYRKFIEPSITAYNELGNRGEAITRAALYAQLTKQGMSHRQASLQARDLMDFSMQGSFTSVRFLTQVVPFFNARLQGLYKLGRAAKEDPARISTVIGAAALAGLGLMLAYSDDDDWRKREDWDKNGFWWFKFGGTAFRIPKPFEVGAIATLAERGFEYAFDKEMTGKRFRANVLALLGDNLSMNPIPQLAKPLLDVYANKDGFTGRPIETMGMEKLKADYRFTGATSMTARGISTAANSVTGLVGKETLSPVQVDALLKGYFGWLGSFVVGAGDVVARPLTGQADRPDSDLFKAATGGMLSDLRDAPSRYVSQMYEQATEIERAYTTWKMLVKEGKTEDAAEFFADNQADITKYRMIEHLKKTVGTLNQQVKRIEQSDESGQTKRERIRALLARKDEVARVL